MALTGIKSSKRYPKNILRIVFIPLYDLHLLVLNWIHSPKMNEHFFFLWIADPLQESSQCKVACRKLMCDMFCFIIYDSRNELVKKMDG